ncbi:MAG TPA: crosslink repair DNA glycosylase YcaQ family protein, partial [Polyangiaceae bacterium]|nr:crosslink repair DNA glycosylase YcaQ family protein [Polyangiaceae bacterium]
APQWRGSLRKAVQHAKQRLASAHVDGIDWYWPTEEALPRRGDLDDERVRLLAPFDPVVWDRRRFELFWGWQYRFEAYTPAAKRKLGYYALPLLWRDQVVGWGNLSFAEGRLGGSFGYVTGKAPSARVFKQGLQQELADIERFLRGRSAR